MLGRLHPYHQGLHQAVIQCMALQVCNDIGHHVGINMKYFEIIDMPEDCTFFSINVFVCNTPVIRIAFKAPVFQLFAELFPEQESHS